MPDGRPSAPWCMVQLSSANPSKNVVTSCAVAEKGKPFSFRTELSPDTAPMPAPMSTGNPGGIMCGGQACMGNAPIGIAAPYMAWPQWPSGEPLRRWRSARSRSHKPAVYVCAKLKRCRSAEELRCLYRSTDTLYACGLWRRRLAGRAALASGLPRGRGEYGKQWALHKSTSPSRRGGQRPPTWRTTACRKTWPARTKDEQTNEGEQRRHAQRGMSSAPP